MQQRIFEKTITPQPARPVSIKPSIDDDDDVTLVGFTTTLLPSIEPEV